MGKGRGRGRGKGGCECCEAIHALACCLCLVLFGGPILIAVGSTLIATANRNDRARGIDSVQAAVDNWNDPNSPTGLAQFARLVAYARWSPSPSQFGCASNGSEARLTKDVITPDRYWDEERLFGGTAQFKMSAFTDYTSFVNCYMTVNLTQQLSSDNGGNNGSMIYIPAMSQSTLSYSIQLDKAGGPRNCATRNDGCSTGNAGNCRSNCENYFMGRFECNGGSYLCTVSGAYISNFAVKLSYQNKNGSLPAGYYVDSALPAAGGGANVMRAGYRRDYDISVLPATVPTGPIFQLPNIAPRTAPTQFSVTLRSAGDPWLTYMAVTEGTGYFGVTKRALMATGVSLVVVGSLGTLFWVVAAFYSWWMLCSRRKPTQRPSGVSGYAWDLANRYGGQYAPALGVPVHGTGQDGMPTAQPLYVPQGPYPNQHVPGQPVAGYPSYQYAQPYGPPGPYPPYPYPQPYPPPGGSVEMNRFPAGQPQPYGYPPPAPPTTAPMSPGGAPDGHPAAAPYSYPYAYPYPPYGGAPPPAGGAPPPPAAGEPVGPTNGTRS